MIVGFLVLVALIAVFPGAVAGSPTELNPQAALSPPSTDHPFGTDQLGRDVLDRVVHGTRISALVATAAALAALVIGGTLGAIAVYGPRWLEEIIMRATDVGLAFPDILLAIVLAAAIGPSLGTTIVVLGIVFTPSMVRVTRAAIFAEYGEDYVTAARLIGTRPIRLVGYHIGLNVALHVLVYVTLIMAAGILAEAALSFLGAGVKPPAPSWGNVIRDGQAIMHSGAWWIALFPGIALVITVLALNRLSESLDAQLRAR